MGSNIKVSIAVPVYNTESYLEQCLDSLINQTIQEKEIIIVDDCSTDRSVEILKAYKERYPELIIVRNEENMGLSITRQRGADLARGEYVGFVDSDDYVRLDMFELLYNKAKEKDADIVRFGYREVKGTRVSYKKSIDDKRVFSENDLKRNAILSFERVLCYKAPMMTWTMMYRRNLFDKVSFENFYLNDEDFYFATKALVVARKVAILYDALYFYRVEVKDSVTFKSKRIPLTLKFKLYSCTYFHSGIDLLNFIEKTNCSPEYKIAAANNFKKLVRYIIRELIVLDRDYYFSKLNEYLDVKMILFYVDKFYGPLSKTLLRLFFENKLKWRSIDKVMVKYIFLLIDQASVLGNKKTQR